MVGVLVGWVVVRLVVCWPVSWDVLVAVDMKNWFLFMSCERGWGRGSDPLSTAESSLVLPDSSHLPFSHLAHEETSIISPDVTLFPSHLSGSITPCLSHLVVVGSRSL